MTRMPPGRGGRLWLHDRLDVARRAGDILEKKTRALIDEEQRLAYLAERTAEDWRRSHRRAEAWYLRAVLLGGEGQIPQAGVDVGERAHVVARWRSTMGATYPSEVSCDIPQRDPAVRLGRSAALPFAAEAYREAVQAAVQHAAATRALRVVRSELDVTRRRLRGIERGWVPRLEAALHRLELRLAEQEREDLARVRWATEREDST